MAFSMAGGGPSGPQINVTPLIDVLLTLIIMFMLVVSMDPEYGEKAQIPQPSLDHTTAVPQVRTVRDSSGVDSKGPASNGQDQSGRCSLDGSRVSSHPDLSDTSREGRLRAGRCGHGLSVCGRCDRSGTSRGRRESGPDDGGSETSRRMTNQEARARFLIQIGVPINPKAWRIWFSRNRR